MFEPQDSSSYYYLKKYEAILNTSKKIYGPIRKKISRENVVADSALVLEAFIQFLQLQVTHGNPL